MVTKLTESGTECVEHFDTRRQIVKKKTAMESNDRSQVEETLDDSLHEEGSGRGGSVDGDEDNNKRERNKEKCKKWYRKNNQEKNRKRRALYAHKKSEEGKQVRAYKSESDYVENKKFKLTEGWKVKEYKRNKAGKIDRRFLSPDGIKFKTLKKAKEHDRTNSVLVLTEEFEKLWNDVGRDRLTFAQLPKGSKDILQKLKASYLPTNKEITDNLDPVNNARDGVYRMAGEDWVGQKPWDTHRTAAGLVKKVIQHVSKVEGKGGDSSVSNMTTRSQKKNWWLMLVLLQHC